MRKIPPPNFGNGNGLLPFAKSFPPPISTTALAVPLQPVAATSANGSNAPSSRARMRSAIPSSQTPSPLKSPAAERLRAQLSRILDGSEVDPFADDDNNNGTVPNSPSKSRPAGTKVKNVVSGRSNGSLGEDVMEMDEEGGLRIGSGRRKARPVVKVKVRFYSCVSLLASRFLNMLITWLE